MINKIVKTTYTNKENFAFTFEPIEDTLTVIKTKEGYEARYLTRDEDTQSPREWDNFGTMCCYHRSYNLGDTTDMPKLDTAQELQKYLIEEKKAAVMLPLFLLDHSGLWMRTGKFSCDAQGWDTSFVGFIYATKDKLKQEEVSKEKAIRILESEVKTYSQYLEGDVYCIVKENYNDKKNPIDYDVVGGYFGYKDAQEALKTEI